MRDPGYAIAQCEGCAERAARGRASRGKVKFSMRLRMSVLYEMFTVLQGFQAPPLLPAGPFYVWIWPASALRCSDVSRLRFARFYETLRRKS